MGKPSIGDAVALSVEQDKKKVVEELTVLNKDSNESIYYLVFEATEKGGM